MGGNFKRASFRPWQLASYTGWWIGCLLSFSPALAQVPATLDPARTHEAFETRPQLRTQPVIDLPGDAGGVLGSRIADTSFRFRSVTIEGATAIPKAKLLEGWEHAVGHTVRVADIYALARSVSRAYRDAGYALSFARVPQQQVEDGAFRIEVVEGFVEWVDLKGELSEATRARARAIADRITASRPLRTADLERYLFLINDLPGVSASAILAPADAAGGSVVILDIDHRPVTAEIAYNSYLPKPLGTHAVSASARLEGVLTGAERIGLTVFKTPVSKGYLGLAGDVSMGVGSEGARVGVAGTWSRIDPSGRAVDAMEYEGRALNAQLYATYPLLRSRKHSLSVGAGLGLSDAQSDILGAVYTDDRLRPLSIWAVYDFLDPLQSENSIKATVEHGLDVLGATGNSRADGSVRYTTLQLDAQRNQPLGTVFDGGVSVNLAAHGQLALGRGSLFSAAECSFGGPRFGRGFDAGALVGDHCVAGSAEAHWRRAFNVRDLIEPVILDVYAFIDGGVLWRISDAAPDEGESAASVGLGVKAQFTPDMFGLVEVSKPIAWSVGDISDTRIAGKLSVKF